MQYKPHSFLIELEHALIASTLRSHSAGLNVTLHPEEPPDERGRNLRFRFSPPTLPHYSVFTTRLISVLAVVNALFLFDGFWDWSFLPKAKQKDSQCL